MTELPLNISSVQPSTGPYSALLPSSAWPGSVSLWEALWSEKRETLKREDCTQSACLMVQELRHPPTTIPDTNHMGSWGLRKTLAGKLLLLVKPLRMLTSHTSLLGLKVGDWEKKVGPRVCYLILWFSFVSSSRASRSKVSYSKAKIKIKTKTNNTYIHTHIPVTYMYDNTPCHPHLPLISATYTFGHTIITYAVVTPSGNNPTMALLPERGRRSLSF